MLSLVMTMPYRLVDILESLIKDHEELFTVETDDPRELAIIAQLSPKDLELHYDALNPEDEFTRFLDEYKDEVNAYLDAKERRGQVLDRERAFNDLWESTVKPKDYFSDS